MNTARSLVALGVVLALGSSQAVWAAQQKEEDSAYQWGRWAVLSPAAGGEPYVAPQEPDAARNARPGEADEFQPKALVDDVTPPVDIAGFCDAGAACGYATYSQNTDGEERLRATAVPEGFDLSGQDPDGPVLARFNLEKFPVAGPADTLNEGEGVQFDAAEVAKGGQGGTTGARFQVTDTGNDNFPDINSVDMDNRFGESVFTGEGVPQVEEVVLNSAGSFTRTTTTQVSTAKETNGYDGVATGQWSDGEEVVRQLISRDEDGGTFEVLRQFDFFQSGGSFVFGTTATLDEMDRFSAGNVQATYRGVVLDYNSAVTLNFDFRSDTFRGNFATENGFSGFEIDGNVQGINFAAQDGAKAVTGSFFNAGRNASGAVNNGTQLGVFATDHVAP